MSMKLKTISTFGVVVALALVPSLGLADNSHLKIFDKSCSMLGQIQTWLFGCVRVSDKDQSENLQIDALRAAGCDVIYGDHGVSGAITKRRGLDDVLNCLEDGDTLVVWKLDRLGRSTNGRSDEAANREPRIGIY